MNKREYSDEEARDILKRAVGYQEQQELTYKEQDLLDLGRELGLTQDAIVKAEQEISTTRVPAISAEEAAFRRERLRPLIVHFAVFLAMVPLMFFLNLMMGLAFPWFLIVVFGWAPGLVGYYMVMGRMEGDDYDAEFAKWRRKRQQRLQQDSS